MIEIVAILALPLIGAAVLAFGRRFDFAVEKIGGELHPVADAENRYTEVEDVL